MAPSKYIHEMSKCRKLDQETMGTMRYLADKRQIAGLLMMTGFCAVIMPLYDIARAVEPNGETTTTGIGFANLIGANIVLLTGLFSVLVGFAETVYDAGHTRATFIALLSSQLVWIPYISAMVEIGMASSTGSAFIPAGYDYTVDDVSFIGAMGIVGVMAYGFSLIGAVAFFQFALYAFQAGKPFHRHASYYRSRQRFYSFILYVAGASQFILGAYIQSRFGSNLAVENGPIVVGFYVISYPGLAILNGLVQSVLGTWCFARTFGYFVFPDKEWCFPCAMGIGWSLQICLQVLAQVAATPGSSLAGFAASVAAFGFGLNLMPAFLDYKTIHTPEIIYPDYYGIQVQERPTLEHTPVMESAKTTPEFSEWSEAYLTECPKTPNNIPNARRNFYLLTPQQSPRKFLAASPFNTSSSPPGKLYAASPRRMFSPKPFRPPVPLPRCQVLESSEGSTETESVHERWNP